MKRNIELIRDFIKFVKDEIKERNDYYNRLNLPVPEDIKKKYDDILRRAYILLEEELDYRAGAFDVAVSPECVDQAVSVDGGGLQSDCHVTELHSAERRHNSLRQQFSTAKIVLHGKTAVLAAVRFHQVCHVVFAAHINANK